MIKTLFALGSMLTATFAQADQCQWNSRATSQTARAIMAKQDMLVTFCANCGDKKMKAYMVTDSSGTQDGKDIHFRSQAKKGGEGYWEFEINKSSKTQKAATLDLAYTYILVNNSSGKTALVNVGVLVNGCTPSGVEGVMEWDPSRAECMSNDGSCG